MAQYQDFLPHPSVETDDLEFLRWQGAQKSIAPVRIARSNIGSVCLELLKPGYYRVLVFPSAGNESVLEAKLQATVGPIGWKQPNRKRPWFSFDVRAKHGPKNEKLVLALKTALYAIFSGGVALVVNVGAPGWSRKIVNRKALLQEVRARKIPGKNLASTWSTPVLCKKLSP